MKKIIILLLLISFGITSCGPKRYKCGPNRCYNIDTKSVQNPVCFAISNENGIVV